MKVWRTWICKKLVLGLRNMHLEVKVLKIEKRLMT